MAVSTDATHYAEALQELAVASLFEGVSENRIISTPGILNALLILEAGARGTTAAELAAITGVAPEMAGATCVELNAEMAEGGGTSHAAAVWAQILNHPDFTAALPDVVFHYGVDQEHLDDWSAAQTRHVLMDFPLRVGAGHGWILSTATHLAEQWHDELFDEDKTKDRAFTGPFGLRTAFFMHTDGASNYTLRGSVHTVDLQLVGGMVLRVGTGAAGESPVDVLSALTRPGTLNAVKLSVDLPRFSIRNNLDLGVVLRQWGATTLCSKAADLSGISPALWIGHVTHDCAISVDEAGVTGATATVVAPFGQPTPHDTTEEPIEITGAFGFVVLKGNLPVLTGWVAHPV